MRRIVTSHVTVLAWCWRLQLACPQSAYRTTVVRPEYEASRRRRTLPYDTGRSQSARISRARSKPECCASAPETANSSAPVSRDTRRLLVVGGRSWHVAPWSCARRERPIAGTASSVLRKKITTSATRCARAVRPSAAPPPQRQRALVRLRCVTRGAGLVLEAALGSLHHGRAPEERGLSPARRPFA